MSILEGELAETIGDALIDADIPLDATVTREIPGDGPPHDPGPSTFVDHPCKGFADTFAREQIDGSLIQATDVKVVIVATSLAIEPSTADKVTIRGTTYSIIGVQTDPAKALWELQARE